MLYCLDTNIIIDIMRGDNTLKTALEKLPSFTYATTPIVLCELFKGAFLAEKPTQALQLVETFSHNTKVLDFDENVCKEYGQQYADLRKRGRMTQEADLLTGCHALVHHAVLITRNTKDFEHIKGLRIMTV